MKHVLGVLAIVAAQGTLAQGFGGPGGLTGGPAPAQGYPEVSGEALQGKSLDLSRENLKQYDTNSNGDVLSADQLYSPEVTAVETFRKRYISGSLKPVFDTRSLDVIQNKDDFFRLLARSPGPIQKLPEEELTDYEQFMMRAADLVHDGARVIGASVTVDPDYQLNADSFATGSDGTLTLKMPFILGDEVFWFTHNGEDPGKIRARLEQLRDGDDSAILQLLGDPGWDRMEGGNLVGGFTFRAWPKGSPYPEGAYFEAQTSDGGRGIITCDGGADGAPCFPEVVSLNIHSRLVCTGALIGASHVLTAAHCFCDGIPNMATTGTRAPNGSARQPAGTHSVAIRDDPIYLKNDFNGRSFCEMRAARATAQDPEAALAIDVATMPYDLAIIPVRERPMLSVLNENTVVTYPAPTARVAAANLYDSASRFIVAGYGRGENSPAGTLLFIDVPKGETPCAGASGHAFSSCDPAREFTLVDDSQDTCSGDSGSAVMASSGHSLGNLVFGVTSRGFVSECGPGGVYVRTHHDEVLNWLAAHVPDLTVITAPETLHSSFLE